MSDRKWWLQPRWHAMVEFGRKSSLQTADADPRRWAATLLTLFARNRRGVFILDGSAIGAYSGHATGNALDVYCLFPDESMARAVALARKALTTMSPDLRIHRGHGMSTFLGALCKRALVIGDRRHTKR